MLKVAIVGYGNIGKYALEAVQVAEDLDCVGVVRRSGSGTLQGDLPVVGDIRDLPDVDVALLCVPSRLVPQYAQTILSLGINTVDSYDVHGQLADLQKELNPVGQAHDAVSLISCGWDPGTDSLIRGMWQMMAPQGLTYTNFGPGMSMGHSTVVKNIPGVRNALSLTIPTGSGVHRRMVYVELEDDGQFAEIEKTILADPYFVNDETKVIATADVSSLIDLGHGVAMERKGVSGKTHNQLFQFEMRINNPALTAQVLVASARATMRQKPGCYTMLEIPIIDYLPGDREKWIRSLV